MPVTKMEVRTSSCKCILVWCNNAVVVARFVLRRFSRLKKHLKFGDGKDLVIGCASLTWNISGLLHIQAPLLTVLFSLDVISGPDPIF